MSKRNRRFRGGLQLVVFAIVLGALGQSVKPRTLAPAPVEGRGAFGLAGAAGENSLELALAGAAFLLVGSLLRAHRN